MSVEYRTIAGGLVIEYRPAFNPIDGVRKAQEAYLIEIGQTLEH